MDRGSGSTTNQLKNAPIGAIFVWVNGHLYYPRKLAESLGRQDLRIFSPGSVENGALRGLRVTAVIVDHAAHLTEQQWIEVKAASLRATIEQPNGERL